MAEHGLFVNQFAVHLGVNPDAFCKSVTPKCMPAHEVGRIWKVKATEVDLGITESESAGKSQTGAAQVLPNSPNEDGGADE